MFGGLGNTNRDLTYAILGHVPEGKMSRTDWIPVIEKVERRLEGWQTKLLSRGGQLLLLRAIAVAKGNTCRDLYILQINKQTTHWSRKEARRIDKAVLVEWSGDGTMLWASIGLVGGWVHTHSG